MKIFSLVVVSVLVLILPCSAQWTTMDMAHRVGYDEVKAAVVHAPEYADVFEENDEVSTLSAWIYAHHFEGDAVFVFDFFDLGTEEELDYSGAGNISISGEAGEFFSSEFEGFILRGHEAKKFNEFVLANPQPMTVTIKQTISSGETREISFTISSNGLDEQSWFRTAS